MVFSSIKLLNRRSYSQNFLVMESNKNILTRQDELISNRVDISFQNIHYDVDVEIQGSSVIPCKKKLETKKILRGITGIAKSGEVTAIMGASGSGKTTLLNILSCRIDRDSKNPRPGLASGQLHANSEEYDFSSFGHFASYVLQNDIFLATLTIRETLEYAGALKLAMPEEKRKLIINQLIKDLKLEACADTLIGDAILKGISGGEKKRTSIAFELISNPSVIMLDEPTSGLDSLTAFIICDYLKKMAQQKKMTVIMTIHQPNSEIFHLFDKLILLAGGKCLYQGRADYAVDYFANIGFPCPQFHNPPDYFISLIHEQSKNNQKNYPLYFEKYERILHPTILEEVQQKNTDDFQKRTHTVPYSQCLGAVLHKDVLNFLKNPVLFKVRVIQQILIALFTGGIFFQISDDYGPIDFYGTALPSNSFYTLIGLMFFMAVCGVMGPLVPVSATFPKQRLVFLKEEASNLYGTLTFAFSKNIIQLPYVIIMPIIWSAIAYFMIGLEPQVANFFKFCLICMLVNIVGASIGLLIGSIVTDANQVTLIMPLFTLPFMLYSGFFKNREDLPKWFSWVEYLSPFKYSYEAFIRNQLSDLNQDQYPLSLLNFEKSLSYWNIVAILFGMSILVRVLAIVFLHLGRTRLQ